MEKKTDAKEEAQRLLNQSCKDLIKEGKAVSMAEARRIILNANGKSKSTSNSK